MRGSEGPSLPPIGRGHPVKSQSHWLQAQLRPQVALGTHQILLGLSFPICKLATICSLFTWQADVCNKLDRWLGSTLQAVQGYVITTLPRWGASLPSFSSSAGFWPFLSLHSGGSHPLREIGHPSGFARDLAGVSVPLSCRIQDDAFPFCGLLSPPPPPYKGEEGYFCARYCATCPWVLPLTHILVRGAQTIWDTKE